MPCPKCGSKNQRQIPEEEFFTKEEKEKMSKCACNDNIFALCDCPPFYSILECLDCGHKEFDD